MRANMALVDVTPQTEVGLNSAFAASYGWAGITNGLLIQKFVQRIMRDSASDQTISTKV